MLIRFVDSETQEQLAPDVSTNNFDTISSIYNGIVADALKDGLEVIKPVKVGPMFVAKISNGSEIQLYPNGIPN